MNYKEKFNDLKARTSFEDDSELFAFFDELPPVTVAETLFPWQGGDFKTGHWCSEVLIESNWFGKWFKTPFDSIPLLCYNQDKKLYSNKTMNNGEATVWDLTFRGKTSATMVYDGIPVFDHFRKVDENTLIGVMNGKSIEGRRDVIDNGRYYFFYLEKLDALPTEFVES